ncbi:hypothetical protein B0H13DRAFT_2314149 [Mycena leptocephala]|nr:hypothetical protein B0H13DRAFT_2314149 [Mycena leptocephala]
MTSSSLLATLTTSSAAELASQIFSKGRADLVAAPTKDITPRRAKGEADLDDAPPSQDTKAAPATRKRPKLRGETDIDAPPTKDIKAAPGTRRRAKVVSANGNKADLEASDQISIERNRSVIKQMKGRALDAQLDLHRSRGDKVILDLWRINEKLCLQLYVAWTQKSRYEYGKCYDHEHLWNTTVTVSK